MSNEANKEAVRQFVVEHNQAEYEACFDRLLAPACRLHEYLPGVPETMDRTAFGSFVAAFRAALPDIRNTVEDVIAEGDKVAVRWTGKGTHSGEALMGIPARGNHATAHGTYVFRFEDGKIAEVWNTWNNLSVLEQLRADPQA